MEGRKVKRKGDERNEGRKAEKGKKRRRDGCMKRGRGTGRERRKEVRSLAKSKQHPKMFTQLRV